MLAKATRPARPRAAPKPDWKCGHCGALLSPNTSQWSHEESLACKASQNKTAAKLRGLEQVWGARALPLLVAEELGLPVESIFDQFRKRAYGKGVRTSHFYTEGWLVELCSGHPHVTPDTKEERTLVEQLSAICRPALADLEVRAKLHTCFALGGTVAVLSLHEGA